MKVMTVASCGALRRRQQLPWGRGSPWWQECVPPRHDAAPHSEFGKVTGYRTWEFARKNNRWNMVPLAAYCWYPYAVPHFPSPEVGPRSSEPLGEWSRKNLLVPYSLCLLVDLEALATHNQPETHWS